MREKENINIIVEIGRLREKKKNEFLRRFKIGIGERRIVVGNISLVIDENDLEWIKLMEKDERRMRKGMERKDDNEYVVNRK